MFLFLNWSGLFKLEVIQMSFTEMCELVYHIGRILCYMQRIKTACRTLEKTCLHMWSLKNLLKTSNKSLIIKHLDRKLTTYVTIHTLKMGTLCQYFSIITLLLKTFSSYEIWMATAIHFPFECYHNHTCNTKNDKLAAFLSCIPSKLQLSLAWFILVKELTTKFFCIVSIWFEENEFEFF